jgi:hypothetical protein
MEGVLQAMVPLKLKFVAAVVLAVGLFGFAFGAGQGLLQGPKSAQAPDPSQPQPGQAVLRDVVLEPRVILADVDSDGLLQSSRAVVGADGQWIRSYLVQENEPIRVARVIELALEQGTIPGQQGSKIPPELIRLLVKENDAEKRKLLGQLIESYQGTAPRPEVRRTIRSDVQVYRTQTSRDTALKASEEALRKLRETAKDKTPEAEVYDAILQAIQKLKTEPKK